MNVEVAGIHLETLAESQEISLLELLAAIRQNPEEYSEGIRAAFNTFVQNPL